MSALPDPERQRRRPRPVMLAAPDTMATFAPIAFPVRRAEIGVVESFRPGEHERAERALADLQAIDVCHLRTVISWADCCTPTGLEWYQWLLPRLAREVEVLPCVAYTPKDSSPIQRPEDYPEFVDEVLTRFGRHFAYLELGNDPANDGAPGWGNEEELCRAIGGAALRAHRRGWKTVLGGIPTDPAWLQTMFARGLMEHLDVLGFHGLSERTERVWDRWHEEVARTQRQLDEHRAGVNVWITQTGVSTWRHDESRQVQGLVRVLEMPVPRAYWYSLHDLDPARDRVSSDERAYHFGMKRRDGTPKLLFRLWSSGGLARVREAVRQSALPRRPQRLIRFPKRASRNMGRLRRFPARTGANAGRGEGEPPDDAA